MKRCTRCLQEKPATAEYFCKDRRKPVGLSSECRGCHKLFTQAYYQKHKEEVLRRTTNWAKSHRQKRREIDSKWSKANPQKLKLKRLRHPEKYRARYILNNAIKSKEIVKPKTCERCGGTGRIHGHHDNYQEPLTVIWLCASCHRKRHKENVTFGED